MAPAHLPAVVPDGSSSCRLPPSSRAPGLPASLTGTVLSLHAPNTRPEVPPPGRLRGRSKHSEIIAEVRVRARVRLAVFSWERGPIAVTRFSIFLDPEEGEKPWVVLHVPVTPGICPACRPLVPVKPTCSKWASTGPSNSTGDASTQGGARRAGDVSQRKKKTSPQRLPLRLKVRRHPNETKAE